MMLACKLVHGSLMFDSSFAHCGRMFFASGFFARFFSDKQEEEGNHDSYQ
jgi:hypothetical protein